MTSKVYSPEEAFADLAQPDPFDALAFVFVAVIFAAMVIQVLGR